MDKIESNECKNTLDKTKIKGEEQERLTTECKVVRIISKGVIQIG